MQAYFYTLVDDLTSHLHAGEVLLCNFRGEETDYVRFNRSRVRQAGTVIESAVTVDLIEGRRHASARFNLTGTAAEDRDLLLGSVETLRAERAHLEDDPYLLYSTDPLDTVQVRSHALPQTAHAIDHFLGAAGGLDLVGVWASGPIYAGFASSLGQRNWYETRSFHVDWSCYGEGDRAVKHHYAGHDWDEDIVRAKLDEARRALEVLARPARTITPGRYRVYLAPAAFEELLGVLAWGGFGLKAHRTRQTPLLKMVTEGRHLSPMLTVHEHHAAGLTPDFTESGFLKPSDVCLIERGVYRDCLVGARSAGEYAVTVNADSEHPESLDVAPGDLALAEVEAQVGNGLIINNLWYGNFSERNDCRITGMTRYACFCVEGGEVVAPVEPMRFDESMYHTLGSGLVALTREREIRFDPSTYSWRSTDSSRLPGLLVDGFTLTL